MENLFAFIREYEQGNFSAALSRLIPSADFCYDKFDTSEFLPQVANYADSLLFGDYFNYMGASEVMGEIAKHLASQDKKFATFADVLQEERRIRSFLPEVISIIPIDRIPFPHDKAVEYHQEIQHRIEALIESKPYFAGIFTKETLTKLRPWHRHPYTLKLNKQSLTTGEIPTVLLEASDDIDYQALLAPFRGKPVLFLCETFQDLYDLMFYDPVCHALLEEDARIFLMDCHPEGQLQYQDFEKFRGKTFSATALRSIDHLNEFCPKFLEALQEAMTSSDTKAMTYLYHLCGTWVHYRKAQRYGKSRSLAYHKKLRHEKWHDPHKEEPTKPVDLGFVPNDFVYDTLVEAQKLRVPRTNRPKDKIHLVHVVPQIIDGTHAPSKLLRCLLYNADRYTFDLSVIVTENVTTFPLDYPKTAYTSQPTSLRAPESLALLQENGIKSWVAAPLLDITTVSQEVAKKLDEWNATIAIFHSPDEVHMLASNMCNVPLRVLFEHGTPPEYPGFDLAILSSDEALKIHKKQLDKYNTQADVLNFSLDIRKSWKEKPFTRESLKLPVDAFIMTTISNHLGTRLSKQMCSAIGAILQRCPKTFYAPMGPIKNEEQLRAYFEPFGVNDRIKFMGNIENPGQTVRSMDLYLNEFPFGSGISIIEAMASGCPVVSMYDEQGPQQGRYGGVYYGLDRVIKSGNINEYIDLACKLATDKDLYKDWSQHARDQYLKRSDEKAYVAAFEASIKKALRNRV